MDLREWLETDGLGGFAMGTVSGIRTRRYHALLLSALNPPSGRVVLVNGVEAWIERAGRRVDLSSHLYRGEVVHPDGAGRIVSFEPEPWPQWCYRLESSDDGAGGPFEIRHEIILQQRAPRTLLRWAARPTRDPAAAPGGVAGTLCVRILLSGRDYHATHHENGAFRFDHEASGERVAWRPYAGLPAVVAWSNGSYEPAPDWYRNFVYLEERARGLDWEEDLASPGIFRFDLARGDALLVLSHEGWPGLEAPVEGYAAKLTWEETARRSRFPTPLERAADQYLARRGAGRTILAGFPWFTDWGRDTFIALRGLCLSTGRFDAAKEILLEWAGVVSRGMLPNRFPDSGDEPEYNAVDASLWYLIAVSELLNDPRAELTAAERRRLNEAAQEILTGYAEGTRFGIRAEGDGLLAAGEPGFQLTWMDARVGETVITPRIGKPVEIEALWLNSLHAFRDLSPRWNAMFETGLRSFRCRFLDPGRGYLADVADVDHRPGEMDWSFRPNQILAIGGLPLPLLSGEAARRVVDKVEARLLTPLGLRSLSPDDARYRGRYEGDGPARDSVYHQGTVWPWLAGPFVDAWVRVRGGGEAIRREARRRFVEPLLKHCEDAGLGHVSEIADGDPPHTPRGCPFQAWSVGELLRLVAHVPAEAPRVLV